MRFDAQICLNPISLAAGSQQEICSPIVAFERFSSSRKTTCVSNKTDPLSARHDGGKNASFKFGSA
jgi:hypothetical protein